jgi:hypothetical protein
MEWVSGIDEAKNLIHELIKSGGLTNVCSKVYS